MKIQIKFNAKEVEILKQHLAVFCGEKSHAVVNFSKECANPGVIARSSNGLGSTTIEASNSGSLNIETNYSTSALKAIFGVLALHKETVTKTVEWITNGLSLFGGFRKLVADFKETIRFFKEDVGKPEEFYR